MAERFTFPQTGDNDDAEHFASLIGQANLSDYVETGIDLQNYNSSGPDIDVTTGKCFISQTSETASTSGDTILSTNSVVQVPATSTLSLTDSAVNEIYVDPDFGTDDNGSVKATTTGVPSGSLKIGEVDTSADTVNSNFNREPQVKVLNITDANGNTVYSSVNNWVPTVRLQADTDNDGLIESYDESLIKDGGAREIDASEFSGASGTDGQVLTSTGAAAGWESLPKEWESIAVHEDTDSSTPLNADISVPQYDLYRVRIQVKVFSGYDNPYVRINNVSASDYWVNMENDSGNTDLRSQNQIRILSNENSNGGYSAAGHMVFSNPVASSIISHVYMNSQFSPGDSLVDMPVRGGVYNISDISSIQVHCDGSAIGHVVVEGASYV